MFYKLLRRLSEGYYKKEAYKILYQSGSFDSSDVMIKAHLISLIQKDLNRLNTANIIRIMSDLQDLVDLTKDINYAYIFDCARFGFIDVLDNTNIYSTTQKDDLLAKIFRDQCFSAKENTLVTYSRRFYFILDFLENRNYSKKLRSFMIYTFEELVLSYEAEFKDKIFQVQKDKEVKFTIEEYIQEIRKFIESI